MGDPKMNLPGSLGAIILVGVLLIGGAATLASQNSNQSAWKTEVLYNRAGAAATTLIADGDTPGTGSTWSVSDATYGTITFTVTADNVVNGKRSITVSAAPNPNPGNLSVPVEAHQR
jgi:hypothetical protein